MLISIIIPVFNEAQALGHCLDRLPRCPEIELLLVDGGSTDTTLAQIRARGLEPLRSPLGRGSQLRAGAAVARGDVFLFLHCDTYLPLGFIDQISRVLGQDRVVAGAFRLRLDAPGAAYRMIELGANLRSRLLGLPYGDQALFMTKEHYAAAGGFPEQPIMEDLSLVRQLRQRGRVALAPVAVTSSARRWQKYGLLRVTVINQFMLLGYTAGCSPEKLAAWYYRRC